VEGLIEYATIYSLQGNHDKAKKYFRHALKFEPNNISANLRLGKIYQTKLNDHTSAIDCFSRILKADPANFKAHYYIGTCYLEKLDYKRATECMKECLKINSRFNLAWKSIGNILYETNSPSKALKYFQKAQECDPHDLEAKIGLANCYYLLENFDLAINLFEEISHIDHNEELEYNLANCYYMRNEYEEAIKHYMRALDMNPKKTECFYNLGNAYCI
jgi:tetratricopeptide (TPR) repeat protein